MRFAILIDAGFAKTKLGSRDNPTTADDFINLVDRICKHPFLVNKYLYRVYYYDAPPFAKSHMKNPLGGGTHDFSKDPLTVHNRKLLKDLAKADHFALRMGEVRFRGWELTREALQGNNEKLEITSQHLRPSIQQKGVDMRIGLDIASLSLKQQVDIIVLITSDKDFIPPMKFARKEGLQLAIVTFNHKGNLEELYEHADLSLSISANHPVAPPR